MPRFRLYSGLTGAEMIIDRDGKQEVIHIERPFFEDRLIVKWIDKRYEIPRSGILLRGARFLSKKGLLGRIVEKPSIMTYFLVFSRADLELEIKERDYVFGQEFRVIRKGKVVGRFRPIGLYLPVVSLVGKGIEGEYGNLPKEIEELLVLSLIAVGV